MSPRYHGCAKYNNDIWYPYLQINNRLIENNINKIFDKNLQSINQILKNFIKNINKEYI